MNFEYSIPDKLSADLILNKVSEESIMQFYLGIDVKSKKLFRSPLRNDHKPTCSLFRNSKGKLIFKDFATNDYLDCFEVVKRKYNCNFFEALKIIANDFGIKHDSSIKKNKGTIKLDIPRIEDKEIARIQVEIQSFTDLELKWWAKYGIREETLKKFNVFSCKHVFLNGNIFSQSQQHCPIFGYYGGKLKINNEKIELWKCYYPKNTSYRFIGNYPSNILQGFKQLPKSGEICIITKSMKDVMALYEYGISACAPNSETVIPKEVVIENLLNRFKYVFALWDCDLVGVTFLNKIKRKYPKLKCFIIPRKLGAKDFSDLRAKYGYKKTKQYIIDYLTYENILYKGLI